MLAMAFTIVADRNGEQSTETAETVYSAVAQIDEFEDRGYSDIHVCDERRTYSIAEIRRAASE